MYYHLNTGHLNIRYSGVRYSDGYCITLDMGIQLLGIQWGSESWTCLDLEWSKRGWVANGLDFEWHLKSGSPTI